MIKKRDAVLQVYVTPEEKELTEKAAQATGLPAAAYVRMLLLNALAQFDAKPNADKRTVAK